MMSRKAARMLKGAAALLFVLLSLSVLLVQAQEATTDPGEPSQTAPSQTVPSQTESAQPAPITVSQAEPTQLTTSNGTTITIHGANFTPQTQAALANVGGLQTTFVDSTTLSAGLPAGLPAGAYSLVVTDPANGSATLPNVIQVRQATVTAAPPTQTVPTEPLTVLRTEPGQITAGQAVTLSVIGTGFSSTTTVRLVGYGFLDTTFVNSQALMASVPATVPLGQYGIEVSDPSRGTVISPNTLNVVQPPTTPALLPTFEPPTQIPTMEPPTPVPGQPALIVRNFTASPPTVEAGGQVQLRFEVVNQGNRPAQGISVSVAADGSFVPASGQASALLGDIQPGGSASVTLDVIASTTATAGPNSVPIAMSYRDFSGQSYTSNATVSVTVGERSEVPQVILVRYSTQPDAVEPGQRIMVNVLVMNTGTEIARQVLLRITGEDGLLLPGAQGDSFALGDIAPQESKELSVPMIVSSSAEPGPQAQPIALSWVQRGETQESTGSITIDVARVVTPQALILLQSYETGQEILEPGDQFTLSLTLQNVGSANANNLLITFGTVEVQSSGGGSSGDGGGTGSGSGSSGGSTGGSTTTSGVPNNAFATIGSGSTIFAGDLPSDGQLTITQQFIVNGTVESGIYSIPITIRYTSDKGTNEQLTLPASVIVLAPPTLQISLASPLPPSNNVGEPVPVTLSIENVGEDPVRLTTAEVTAENGEVMDGATSNVGAIAADDDASVTAMVIPSAEGTFSVTFTLNYRDDLNQMRALTYTYQSEAVTPPPPPEEPMQPEMPVATPEPQEDNSLGRLLLGFLGLGG